MIPSIHDVSFLSPCLYGYDKRSYSKIHVAIAAHKECVIEGVFGMKADVSLKVAILVFQDKNWHYC
jgi:hypothetical protein